MLIVLVTAVVVHLLCLRSAAVTGARANAGARALESHLEDVEAVMQLVDRAALSLWWQKPGWLIVPGAIVFTIAKMLKWWAITSLGTGGHSVCVRRSFSAVRIGGCVTQRRGGL